MCQTPAPVFDKSTSQFTCEEDVILGSSAKLALSFLRHLVMKSQNEHFIVCLSPQYIVRLFDILKTAEWVCQSVRHQRDRHDIFS